MGKLQKTNSRYEIIIYWSDVDNAYLAEVPELAGCMADGASYQEALANAQIVIDDWLNIALETNRFIPEPKGRLLYA
jgi:predicted RNase H-like HicB family nuclease